ncbi:MAG: hypothetical protein K8W52_10660 [Deltaproteobacteria bacterium]|nr:hypothetical protein [Deltaproteobacteria bacterium]
MRALVAAMLLAACGSSGGGTAAAVTTACDGAACDARCEGGDLAACARAAELYYDGKNGHALDMARSFQYATRACDGGNPHGCTFVGLNHQDGLSAGWDPAKAIAAYEKACRGGAGTGCFNLATMYSGGQGVTVDLAKADRYKRDAAAAWTAACHGSEPRWCTNAAFLMADADGKGGPSPATMATMRALEQRACDAKVLVGCTELARLTMQQGELAPAAYVDRQDQLCGQGEVTACVAGGALLLDGQRVPRDAARGIALYRRGCDAGDRNACEALGVEEGLGEFVAKDEAAAERHLTMACDRASPRACQAIAKVRARAGDAVAARALLERGCHMGDGEACGVLGAMIAAGTGGPADPAAALPWTRLGCQQGYGPACDSLIERGLDLPIPPEFTGQFYREACGRGVARACTPP